MTKKQEPGGWKEGIFRILPTADIDRQSKKLIKQMGKMLISGSGKVNKNISILYL